MSKLTRRRFFQVGGAAATGAVLSPLCMQTMTGSVVAVPRPAPFRYALNSGTLLGFKLSVEDEIDVAAKAGYDAIEPWVRGLDAYLKQGKKLSDLRKRIQDHNLTVAGACAFFQWIVDDDEVRTKGIEQMKREMELCREIGCTRIAATAAGATNKRLDDFKTLGDRYRTILEIGEKMNVIPQLEVWGASQTMNSLADVTAIAIHSGHPKAELLLDVYHLYRGDSSFEGLAMLNGRKMPNFHVNDYPADPPREQAKDADRVYVGDGVAPFKKIFYILREIGFSGTLSFEVFNPTYWATNDPLKVVRTGLEKMKAVADML